MSATHTEHAEETPHAHDPAEEIAHAKAHAVENIYFFAGFLTLILFAVANYELGATSNVYVILALAAARCLLIAGFFVWLIGRFSFIVRTFLFTVLFLGGMIFLSWWDSALKGIGNPIVNKTTQHP